MEPDHSNSQHPTASINHSPSKEKKKPKGKTNRNKGHNAERSIVHLFKDIGYEHACTTRASSNLLDSCGIDLNYVPVIIQSKAGTQAGLNPMAELKSIEEKMHDKLPMDDPWFDKVKAVVQLRPARGPKRTKYDDRVTMTLEDFMKLVQKAYPMPVKPQPTIVYD